MVHAKPKPVIPLLDFQREDIESNARFRWSCWARQTGKSFTKSLRRVIRGIKRRRNQIFLSASERQSKELMQKARMHCQALEIATTFDNNPILKGTKYNQLEIELPNGVRIIGLPANPETVRGFTGDVFLDEFAMHAHDRDIWAAIFPTLLRGNGELDVASTPKGKNNVFYDLSQNDRFEKSVVTLDDAIAQCLNINADDIRASMGDDELYRQEFNCEFLDESTAFLTHDMITTCQDPTLDKTPDITTLNEFENLCIGVDVGRKRDLTVIWIIQREYDHLITRAVYERQNETFQNQFDLLASLLDNKHVHRLAIDAGGIGMQLAESLVDRAGQHRVTPVTFTNTIKNELANKLRIHFENRSIRIPVDPDIRNDFHSLRRTITTTGLARFDAQRSQTGHADRFWAAALATSAAAQNFTNTNPQHLTIKPLAFANTGTW